MTALIAVAAVLGFGVVLVYAYNKGREDGESRVPPIIQAQEGPTKVRPESPGGMDVPHRDKEIFNRLEPGEEEQTDKVERLLPPPEKPIERPVAPAEEDAGTPSGQVDEMETAAGGDQMAAATPPETSGTSEPPPAPPEAGSADTPATEPSDRPGGKDPASIETPPQPPEESETAVESEPEPPPPQPAEKPAREMAARPADAPEKTRAAPAGRWKIQLASLRSEAGARKSWDVLRKKYPDLLDDLSLDVQRVDLSGGKGTFYRVQAGPLASREAAGNLCTQLKARKQGCLVVRP